MEIYILLLAVFGAVVLLTAWLPMLLKELPLSLPIVCIVIGMLLVWSPLFPLIAANPLENRLVTERLTEFVVIVSLMGAGLKLDRALSWRGWESTWRLLGIAMPLTIVAITLLAGRSSGSIWPQRSCSAPPLLPPTRCSQATSKWVRRNRARTTTCALP